MYMLPNLRRVELSSEWSNRVATSIYARLFIWIELSGAVKRMYVNNSIVIHNRLKFTSAAGFLVAGGRVLD